MSSDAFHMTAPPEDGSGAAACMDAALKDARIDPAKVDYINAHATSTPLGDLAETKAIKTCFGAHAGKDATGKDVHGSLNDYFREQSAGAFRLEGKVFDWVAVAKKRGDYIQGSGTSNKTAVLTDALTKLVERALPKGDVLTTAKVAGVLAAKQTPALIPLTHPVDISSVDITFDLDHDEPRVLEWLGAGAIADGARQWFGLLAVPADAPVTPTA